MGDESIISVESIGKILGGFVSSGGVGSVASAIDSGLKLILRLTEDDPVKRAKALREYELDLMAIIKEAPNAEGKDLSNITLAFIRLMDGK